MRPFSFWLKSAVGEEVEWDRKRESAALIRMNGGMPCWDFRRGVRGREAKSMAEMNELRCVTVAVAGVEEGGKRDLEWEERLVRLRTWVLIDLCAASEVRCR